MSKLCVQVESYLQQRFPVTAPHNKGANDKQLFSSNIQPVKGEANYSPKTIFKKQNEHVFLNFIFNFLKF